MLEKSPSKLSSSSLSSNLGGVAVLAELLAVTVLDLPVFKSFSRGDGVSSNALEGEGVVDFPLPKLGKPVFRENPEFDLMSGGLGISLKGLSCGDRQSSCA